MNTVASTIYGWAAFTIVGFGALYFARRDIKERRREAMLKQGTEHKLKDKSTWEERVARHPDHAAPSTPPNIPSSTPRNS
ncbi:hypothetical protein SeLEV6574_g05918 [Synchytrium endobioticum]|uniref:Uncharacterized protein n=1 Tax=Synchytrium endobioticum TaxID=286115 RepID=A0A507CRL7_9FUNG|nr:hypothetical protein SeLEV6574_g05918 [Synchytrium endobioticum]